MIESYQEVDLSIIQLGLSNSNLIDFDNFRRGAWVKILFFSAKTPFIFENVLHIGYITINHKTSIV